MSPAIWDTVMPELSVEDAEHVAQVLMESHYMDGCAVCSFVANVLVGDAAKARVLAKRRTEDSARVPSPERVDAAGDGSVPSPAADPIPCGSERLRSPWSWPGWKK